MTAGDEGRAKQQCPYCKEWCAHGFCGRCERILHDEGRAAARRAEIRELADRIVDGVLVKRGFTLALKGSELYEDFVRVAIAALAECDRRSRAVEALIAQWREVDTDGHAHDPAVAFNQGVLQCADELEAALASPAPAAEDT